MSAFILQVPSSLLILGLLPALARASPSCYPSPVIQLSLGNCTVLEPAQSDVHSWGIQVGVVDADNLCVVPSTVLSNTFLTTEDLCSGSNLLDSQGLNLTADQCRSRRGGFIPQSASLQNASTAGLDEANPNWKALGNDIQGAAQASLRVFDQSVPMVVGLISNGQQSTASHLGLASASVFLQTLKDQGLIGAHSFGLDVGSQSVAFPRRGTLTLGGYDQASLAGSSFYDYNITFDKLQERYCPMQVSVTDMRLLGWSSNPKTNTSSLVEQPVLTRSSGTKFCIEPYDNLFRLPNETVEIVKDIFQSLTSWTNGTVDDPREYSGRLVDLEPGLVYPAAAGPFNATMRITINNELTVEIPTHELWRPLKGLDANGTVVLDDSYNELQIYGSNISGYAPVLGKAFLSQVYAFVDYDAQPSPIFRLAPQTTDPTTAAAAVSSASCTELDPWKKGVIAMASVLGAIVAGALTYGLYWYCCARTARGGKRDKEPVRQRTESQDEVENRSEPIGNGTIPATVEQFGSETLPYTGGGHNYRAPTPFHYGISPPSEVEFGQLSAADRDPTSEPLPEHDTAPGGAKPIPRKTWGYSPVGS